MPINHNNNLHRIKIITIQNHAFLEWKCMFYCRFAKRRKHGFKEELECLL